MRQPLTKQRKNNQSFSWYEIIGIHENLLFGYQEFPAVVEEPPFAGKLNTSGTPQDWKDSRSNKKTGDSPCRESRLLLC
ncbi:hypothetical protein [Paenibacillus albidus]|uniref:hypothetical protein n=1 Tax=Paenibacillus albidus TaxID=2041023 RepID=UPI001667946F|nr:hypothetical protein [Paenibacillus albidus]